LKLHVIGAPADQGYLREASPPSLGVQPHEGFEAEKKQFNDFSFGDVQCHLATIQNIECAVVIPSRSHYSDVLEILCKYHLRRTLGLNDNDPIEVRVSLI